MQLSKSRRDVRSLSTRAFTALIIGGAVAAFAVSTAVHAEDASPAFKLTATGFKLSESGSALDVNLRHSSDFGNAWIGYFRAPKLEAQQWRGGWDRSFGDVIRVQPSAQIASGGFVGGSINLETGERWFVGAGFGRTNLRPYFNLNFDPNDSWSLAGGYRGENGQNFSASYVRDNRENPDQQHFHLTSRTLLDNKDRVTLDLLYKRGLVDGRRIAKAGGTVTYDWPKFFVRVAYDPNTNFTADNVWRVSVGTRF